MYMCISRKFLQVLTISVIFPSETTNQKSVKIVTCNLEIHVLLFKKKKASPLIVYNCKLGARKNVIDLIRLSKSEWCLVSEIIDLD